MHLGYYDEARAFRDWLMRAVAGAPAQMQILYGVGGERWLPEFIIPWLPGYEKSPPVRIGNAASEQLQLDIYGEISDAMFQAIKGGMEPSERGVALQPVIMEHLAKAWREPDEGIWETRGGRQHFVHSKVMAWVAFDRAANLMKDQNYAHSARGLREIANEIHADICNRGFDPALDSFVQAYGSKRVDASLLVIPLVGFLPATDPRIRGTLRAIENKLLVDDEFVQRYDTENPSDGLPPGEGAFLACSFWLVDNYILQGRYAEARKLFDRLLGRCNEVGLLTEEIDSSTGRMLGNFPQAYSHVGVINCALNLSRQTDSAHRAGHQAQHPLQNRSSSKSNST
jgi:GH15 family glucan-1,4-alpha-glucosidase